MKHIVMYSGGVGSWIAARRVVEWGFRPVLLFADTKMEDPDLYRFLDEGAQKIGAELVKIAEGRNPWEVFFDVKLIGNTRADPCSFQLKRRLLRKWLEHHCDATDTWVHLGMDWTEDHRFERAKGYWEPWNVRAPLCEPPYLMPSEKWKILEEVGLEPPQLYKDGFAHNNCGGFCIKAGQAQFRRLYKKYPERYRFHESCENEFNARRAAEGKEEVSVLRDRRGGKTKPLTMQGFRREYLEAGSTGLVDGDDWGGCGCMEGDDGVQTQLQMDLE
jgi:hypothetical protein